MKKVVVVSSNQRFLNSISDDLNCDSSKVQQVYSPKEFLELFKVSDPELIILDCDYVEKEDLFGYYTFSRWCEIQMIVTNVKSRFNFSYLIS